MKLYPNLRDLVDYAPKERGIISIDEIRHIQRTLHLDEATEDDIFNYRSLVVALWTDRYRDQREKGLEMADSTWDAMMSITAVLDNAMYERGGEV